MNDAHSSKSSAYGASFIVGLVIAVFVGLMTGQILMRFLSEWEAVYAMSIGVVDGVTAWRAWQNRLLSPYLFVIAGQFGLEGVSGLKALTYAGISIAAPLVYVLAFRATRSVSASCTSVLAFSILYLFLQDRALFLWDTLDIIFFAAFAYAAVNHAHLGWIVLLALLATLNRESGLFIALFIIISSFDLSQLHRLRIALADKMRLAIGAGVMIVCVAYTKLSRDLLFSQTMGGTEDLQHELIGNHIQLVRNLRDLLKNNWTNENVLHTVLVLCSVGFLIWSYFRVPPALRPVVVLTLAMLGGIVTFGVVNEPRVFLSIMPMFIFLSLQIFAARKP